MAATCEPALNQRMGGNNQNNAGSHITYGSTARMMPIGGARSGAPVARFLVHPATISPSDAYIRDAVSHGLVRANLLVGCARRENELPIRDRVPGRPRAVHRREIGKTAFERDEDMRLNQTLPERPHLLPWQYGEEIGALLLKS